VGAGGVVTAQAQCLIFKYSILCRQHSL
jgi:hypothetical protein